MACLEKLNKGLSVLDLDKWLLKTGGPLIQVAFITDSTGI